MLFRLSKMLMNKVDSGGAGAAPVQTDGGQPGNTPPQGDGQQAQAAGQQQQAPKTFTQEEVNAIVKDRLARASGQGAGAPQGQQVAAQTTTAQQTVQAKPDAPVTRQEFEEWQRRSAFDKRTSKLGLTPAAEEDLWTLYNVQKPTDPDAWFTSKQETLGLKGQTQVQDPNNVNGNPGNGNGTPPAAAPNAGGKVDPITSGGLVDIFNLPLDKVVSLGPQGLRKLHEQNLDAARARDGAPPIPKMPAR